MKESFPEMPPGVAPTGIVETATGKLSPSERYSYNTKVLLNVDVFF